MSEISSPDLALKEAIEKEFSLPIGESTNGRLAITNEPYITLCSGGVKSEGGMFPAWFPTPDTARAAYRKSFIEYGVGVDTGLRLNRLYWREPPELYERTIYEVDGNGRLIEAALYSIWSRLLISGQQIMEKAV